MGDPRRIGNKFNPPSHPWQKERIDEEKRLRRSYAFKNKKEIWKMTSQLKNFQAQAKRLNAARSAQAEKETKQLLTRLQRLGLLTADNATLDAVLDLKPENLMDRRLQSVVHRLGFAHTMKQARQFISHHHIGINGVPLSSPSYLVSVEEEARIDFLGRSPLADEMHPERQSKEQRAQAKAEEAAAEESATKTEVGAEPAKAEEPNSEPKAEVSKTEDVSSEVAPEAEEKKASEEANS